MAQINEEYLKLPGSYLFAEIAKRVAAFKAQQATATASCRPRRVISLGIGDVTLPLCPAVVQAMHRAADEMGSADTFHGYGPEQGYAFLREAIVRGDYAPLGVDITPDEVFVNDGAKSDTGNIGEIVSRDNIPAVTDPVYPVYIDSNVMCGRAGVLSDGAWSRVCYLPCTADNGFVPALPQGHVDLIYLCYPNNPTGAMISRAQLAAWVSYALQEDALIFYDAAYSAYIRDAEAPRSIYEIPGAERCAIEFRSFSKTAGFTGVRCGYTVVPRALTGGSPEGRVGLAALWLRRQCTKFNGTSYISQRAAEAIYSAEGAEQVRAQVDYYMENARLMREALTAAGFAVYGGQNAPYLWVRTPAGMSSWQCFDHLLHDCAVVCTPGVGFGPSGEGYVRLTAFGKREDTIEALARINE